MARPALALALALALGLGLGLAGGVPVPNAQQLAFMDFELVQFMHFGAPTFWDPPTEYLYTANPTYHNCE